MKHYRAMKMACKKPQRCGLKKPCIWLHPARACLKLAVPRPAPFFAWYSTCIH